MLLPEKKRQSGFTLLELLVALGIFALIGISSFTLLNTVVDVKETTDIQARALAGLQNSFMFLEQDLRHVLVAGFYAEDDAGNNPLAIEESAYLLSFFRAGRNNPFATNRSDLLAVGYALEMNESSNINELVRYSWVPDVDHSSGDEIQPAVMRQVLAEGIQDITLRYVDENNTWTTNWESGNSTAGIENIEGMGSMEGTGADSRFLLPEAIELLMRHDRLGELNFIFKLSRGLPRLMNDEDDELQRLN